ncbi:MAG: hypothetical protein KF856_15005 [Cyclobacteriaceae bacterium]|nr:hypothetical protein [Cyclobacteriaceae bacterium]
MNTRANQNLKKAANSALPASGIAFGNQQSVQFKITHKDLILVAGILVALIVAITTWMWGFNSQTESRQLFPTPDFSKAVLHKIGNTIIHKF